MPARGLIALVPVYWCLGVTFAAVDLSTIAFAQEHGHKPLAGIILGSYALGSAIGGLLYGSRTWRTPVERRFLISLCCTAAGISTFWAQTGLLSLVLVIFISGLTISPTFIAGVQPGREPGAGSSPDGRDGLALLVDLGWRGIGIGHRRAHH